MEKTKLLELLEKDEEFRLAVAGLIGYREILERLEEHDRKFEEIMQEIKRINERLEELYGILAEHNKRLGRVEETVGTLVETYLLDRFSTELREIGLDLDEIRGVEIEGMEIDGIFRDEELIAVEVESTLRKRDLLSFMEKIELLREKFPKRKVKGTILCMRADSSAIDLADREKIKVLSVIKSFSPSRG